MTNEQDRIVKAFAKLPKAEQIRLASSYSLLSDWIISELPPTIDPLDPLNVKEIWKIIKMIIAMIFSTPIEPIK